MHEITIDSGIRTIPLVGPCGRVELSINPTDPTTIRRLYDTFKEMDGIGVDEKDDENPDKVFARVDDTETMLRGKIDEALGMPVCDELFGDISVLALSHGLPIWQNLLFGILDWMDAEVNAEKKQTNPRMEKYIKKYTKKK